MWHGRAVWDGLLGLVALGTYLYVQMLRLLPRTAVVVARSVLWEPKVSEYGACTARTVYTNMFTPLASQ